MKTVHSLLLACGVFSLPTAIVAQDPHSPSSRLLSGLDRQVFQIQGHRADHEKAAAGIYAGFLGLLAGGAIGFAVSSLEDKEMNRFIYRISLTPLFGAMGAAIGIYGGSLLTECSE